MKWPSTYAAIADDVVVQQEVQLIIGIESLRDGVEVLVHKTSLLRVWGSRVDDAEHDGDLR